MSLSNKTSSIQNSSEAISGTWLKRLAILSLLILPLSVMGYRIGLYNFPIALIMLAASLLVAAITFFGSLVINLKHRSSNPSNSKQAQLAMYISLVSLLFLGSQVVTAKSVPRIHNISTDMVDPPQFSEIVALRGSDSNPHTYNANEIAELQKAAYPKIKTLSVQESPGDAFNKSLLLIDELGWDLVSTNQQLGIIEASQTSKLWGFTDDVVIRITEANGKADIDLRSVSRVGRSDLGANAKRIQRFFDAYR